MKKAKSNEDLIKIEDDASERGSVLAARSSIPPDSGSLGEAYSPYTDMRYQTPDPRSHTHQQPRFPAHRADIGDQQWPRIDRSYATAVGNPNATHESARETPKLKGVQLPGMSVFDAATQEQRRMRNQRKDKSVVERMEKASTMVQRDETVHRTDFEIERTRDMYASPSIDGSPVSSCSTGCRSLRSKD
jgi:hypothetical protein